jgi:hypothetical protein
MVAQGCFGQDPRFTFVLWIKFVILDAPKPGIHNNRIPLDPFAFGCVGNFTNMLIKRM